MNVAIKNTYDIDETTNRIFVRFTGHITFTGKGAEQIAEGIRTFLHQCESECWFLSHREPKPIVSQSPNDTWTFPVDRGIQMQWNCTPMQAFASREDRDLYIKQVLRPRGYTRW